MKNHSYSTDSHPSFNWYIEVVVKPTREMQFLWYPTRAKARFKAKWYRSWAAVESATVRKVS